MVSTQQNLRLGGLGPNVGNDEWEKAKKKKDQIQEYAKNLKIMNQVKPQPVQKKKDEKPKEKTAREKALEFSKNVPKPKVKGKGNAEDS